MLNLGLHLCVHVQSFSIQTFLSSECGRHFPKTELAAAVIHALDYERPQLPNPHADLTASLISCSVSCWCLNASCAGAGEYLMENQQDGIISPILISSLQDSLRPNISLLLR